MRGAARKSGPYREHEAGRLQPVAVEGLSGRPERRRGIGLRSRSIVGELSRRFLAAEGNSEACSEVLIDSGWLPGESDDGEFTQAAKGVVEHQRPLPVALKLEDQTTTGVDKASSGVQESVAQALRFPAACLASQT